MNFDEGSGTSPALLGRQSLIDAIGDVLDDLQVENATEAWANPPENPRDLFMFLEPLTALLGSIERAYEHRGEPVPDDPWVVMADVMRGARYYE